MQTRTVSATPAARASSAETVQKVPTSKILRARYCITLSFLGRLGSKSGYEPGIGGGCDCRRDSPRCGPHRVRDVGKSSPRPIATEPLPAPGRPDSGQINAAREHAAEWVAQILARPLFSPSRRPAATRLLVSDRPAQPPRLSGMLSWPGGKYAIFQTKKATPSVVAEGGTLAGWSVQTITAEGVTISDGETRLVIHPTFVAIEIATLSPPIWTSTRARDAWGQHLRPPTYLERRHK